MQKINYGREEGEEKLAGCKTTALIKKAIIFFKKGSTFTSDSAVLNLCTVPCTFKALLWQAVLKAEQIKAVLYQGEDDEPHSSAK